MSEKIDPLTSAVVLHRDRATCVFCGARKTDGAKITCDHLLPRAWGGKDLPTNLVACCSECNTLKGTADHIAFAEMVSRLRMNKIEIHRRYPLSHDQMLAAVAEAIALPLDYDAAARIVLESARAQNAARRASRKKG